jgi:hypothetical protein
MIDLHTQLDAWLADGAHGDPPREIAVHASVCERCTASLGAFDALALIDVGSAGSPPPLAARSPLRVGMAWARVGTAVTATVLAGLIVGFGIAQLARPGPPAGPAGQPEGTELAGLFMPSDGTTQTDQPSDSSPPGEAPTATGLETPLPGVTPGPQPPPPPGATPRPPTPRPSATAAPTPAPSEVPTPSKSPSPTPEPTAEPTPEPTPTPTPSPLLPQCSNTLDDDGDGAIDWPDDPDCSNAFDDSEAPPP